MVHDQLVDDRAEPLLPAEEAGKLRSALRVDLSVGCSRGGVLQPCRRKHEPPSREARAQLPLGPNEHATEGDICDMYARLGWDERDQLGAVLVLKLALSLTASGMPTYTAEPLLRTVAAAANLPHCHLLLGMRSLQISFGGGPVHVLSSRQGKVLHRLSDLHCLTLAVAVAVEPATLMALQAVDAINRRRSPFGWAIEALAYHGFACAAAPAIFGGGLGDFAVVALASVPVRLTLAACGALPQLSALSDLLLPIVAGVAAPSLCALFELDACHAATATLSLLLFELPGSELLFGATASSAATSWGRRGSSTPWCSPCSWPSPSPSAGASPPCRSRGSRRARHPTRGCRRRRRAAAAPPPSCGPPSSRTGCSFCRWRWPS